MTPIRIAILVSGHGRGSNMQAIIDACKSGKINGNVEIVIGVNDDAPAMIRASESGIAIASIDPKNYESSDKYDEVLFNCLLENNIDLICLAGYMRLLGQNIVDKFRNKIMNVHPALIPMFFGKGMYGHHVHEAAVKRGVKLSGATVHFVDEEYDTGPIIIQETVPAKFDDTPDELAARILPVEHKIYTEAIALFSRGKLEIIDRKVNILPE